MDYTELSCPVCSKQFTNDDDIVVCPECGAPHHRECYDAEGHCHFEDRHCDGFDFKNPDASPSESEKTKKCPFCDYSNPADSLYCNHCGLAFPSTDTSDGTSDNDSYYKQPSDSDQKNEQTDDQGFNSAFSFDPLGGVKPEDEVGTDITAGEAAKFVKVNTPFYARLFHNIYNYNRSRFSFAGFLFSCSWVMYRKMYKIGTVLTLLFGLTMIARVYISFVYNDLLVNMQNAIYGVSPTFFMTFDQNILSNLKDFLSNLSSEQIIALTVFYLTSLIQTAIQVVCGICGNRWYYKHCMSKITDIKLASPSTSASSDLLQTRGGVNFAIVISLYISYLILLYLPRFF